MCFAAILTSSAGAAAGRLERPVTDAVPTAPTAPAIVPRPPFVFAPQGGPRVIDLANPMRETSPGEYEGIVPVQQADGSVRIDLDERFLLFSVARLAPGGSLAHSCVSGLEGLGRWQGAVVGAACEHSAAPVAAAKTAVQPKVTTPGGVVRTQWEAQ